MPQYKAPVRDFEFVLKEWLNVSKYNDIQGFEEVDDNLITALLDQGAKLCEEVLFPINQSGDAEGVKFDNGKVTVPSGFKEAYQTYVQSGWTSFTCSPDFGGQGLPEVLNMSVSEMICSSNLSFGITPGLTHGAYNAIYMHATDEIKQKFLPKMVDGTWSGVMCLTEPQCGTDLGLIRTKAIPNEDGTYKISGSKIFISAGEQDITENIIHLVLAKLPDAPAGVKGISLFVVPKIWVNDDGSLGGANNVTCGSIEHKMGIHASPTCVMNYDTAVGYLVGEAHKGLRAMFTMMNEARLYVGIQGLGLSEVSYQNAAQYASERLQGRSLKAPKYPEKEADPLLVHPDIRRMLLTMRSFNEGARALACYTALQIDISKKHDDNKVKELADDFVQFITPILKSYYTDAGFESTNMGMQIFGGHGYIKEYGMEQYVRDARIAQIYEGANGIQALDLVGRKLPKKMGKYLRSFFHPADNFVNKHRDNPEMSEYTKDLYMALKNGQQASLWIAANGMGNPDEAAAGSSEYLRLMALVVFAYIWVQLIEVSLRKLKEDGVDKDFYEAKISTGKFFMKKILPQTYGLLASIVNGAKPVMEMKEEAFLQ
ncbi:MAG: acyl-CoA dehydrogenase C-terminal domain-containing protein [Rickettsiales bacterium]|nr:acyl-CoA dehydrogenase C-terminal domain-containing protein [Pseudomonadota bacterium]MDA0966218.1 acyl-CoA dehydrogenase C-terminal domain-containing protein [Pseudomonadota bacterium]MDG4543117.1 acyl-CoA dehydrogenase C-terminal domain-containing protein [Rickettsiales bacterium]MDG4545315.1 acyl-CoA dehydrogenase C-terminal domain-containing protein [Rickettsiales bacterium]MDG4547764.1 acyl-CoA dehydrogenase C-terminal domain-containing protein [Rickettsiales bacterium]